MKDKDAQLMMEALQQVDKKDVVQEARPYIDWSQHGGAKKEEPCPKCGDVHPINASCGVAHEADVKDYVPPHDEDKLKRAKERGYDDDSGPLNRVAKVVIDKLGDITDYSSSSDYSVSDLIDVTIEDVESEMGERQHELNEPNANDKIKDLIIRNLSDDRSHLMQGYNR